MKKPEKLSSLEKLLLIIMNTTLVMIIVGSIALVICTLIAYGDKPASEIPGWVWWLWFK